MYDQSSAFVTSWVASLYANLVWVLTWLHIVSIASESILPFYSSFASTDSSDRFLRHGWFPSFCLWSWSRFNVIGLRRSSLIYTHALFQRLMCVSLVAQPLYVSSMVLLESCLVIMMAAFAVGSHCCLLWVCYSYPSTTCDSYSDSLLSLGLSEMSLRRWTSCRDPSSSWISFELSNSSEQSHICADFHSNLWCCLAFHFVMMQHISCWWPSSVRFRYRKVLMYFDRASQYWIYWCPGYVMFQMYFEFFRARILFEWGLHLLFWCFDHCWKQIFSYQNYEFYQSEALNRTNWNGYLSLMTWSYLTRCFLHSNWARMALLWTMVEWVFHQWSNWNVGFVEIYPRSSWNQELAITSNFEDVQLLLEYLSHL